MNIGSAIKSIRKKLGIPQWDLAEKCGLSQTSLSQIENNQKRPSPKTVAKLCSVLEIPESIIYIVAMEDVDVPDSKKRAYQLIYPSIKNLAMQMVNPEHRSLIDENEEDD